MPLISYESGFVVIFLILSMSGQGSSQYDFDNAVRAYVDPHQLHHFNVVDDYDDHDAKIENVFMDKNTFQCHLTPSFEHKIKRNIYKLLAKLDAHTAEAISAGDKIYTGTAGIAMLKLLCDERFPYRSPTLDKAYELTLKSADECHVNDRISFLNGNAGVVALAAVAHHKAGNTDKVNPLLKKLVEFSKYSAIRNSSAPPDELLYGRAGYLYALLYVRKHIPNATEIVSDFVAKQVVQDIIDSGIQSAKAVNCSSPLHYKWHDKEYLGAAHGYAGILQVLLLARKQKLVPYAMLKDYIRPAMLYVMSWQLPSRNYPSSVESKLNDKLVQWCHGAPGMIFMGAAADAVLLQEDYGVQYRYFATDLGEVTWYRGLLKKGYSLCHGVAGNGYALLKLYNMTEDIKYLNRAARFAEWCVNYGANQTRVPDRPWSLYEGISGVIYFLIDILNFDRATFPGADL